MNACGFLVCVLDPNLIFRVNKSNRTIRKFSFPQVVMQSYGSLCVSDNMFLNGNNGAPKDSPSRGQNLKSVLDDPSRSAQAIILHSLGFRHISPRILAYHVSLDWKCLIANNDKLYIGRSCDW